MCCLRTEVRVPTRVRAWIAVAQAGTKTAASEEAVSCGGRGSEGFTPGGLRRAKQSKATEVRGMSGRDWSADGDTVGKDYGGDVREGERGDLP